VRLTQPAHDVRRAGLPDGALLLAVLRQNGQLDLAPRHHALGAGDALVYLG
jgi:hypothetical protein